MSARAEVHTKGAESTHPSLSASMIVLSTICCSCWS